MSLFPCARLCLLAILVGVVCAALGAPQAHAQADITYEQAIERAVTAAAERDWERARDWFEQAHAIEPNARTLRGQGIVALEMGQLAQAHRLLVAALSHQEKPLQGGLRTSVEQLVADLETQLARLRVEADVNDPALLVDGKPAPSGADLWLEPGAHRILISAPGHKAVERSVDLERGQHEILHLTLLSARSAVAALAPIPSDPAPRPTKLAVDLGSSTRALRAKRALAVSSAVLATGAGVIWLTALLDQAGIKETCASRPTGGCTTDEVHDLFVEEHMTARVWTSRIGLGFAVLSGIGATIFSFRARDTRRLDARISPNGVTASVRF